jgi:trans-aconitate methyltransferase
LILKTKLIKNNIPAGNWENKYITRNPVGKFFIHTFIKNVKRLVLHYKKEIQSITELGCGEGYLTNEIHSILPGIPIKGCDFSEEIIHQATTLFPFIHFYVKSIYDTGPEEKADLILCCEVLEHLEYPEKALYNISKITQKYCLLSVPNEPLWRIMNMARGKYLHSLGNTPGHIQHWSYQRFLTLIRSYMDVIHSKFVIPWTIVFCKKKSV